MESLLGLPATAEALAEFLAERGPWEVKTYPAVGKVSPPRRRRACNPWCMLTWCARPGQQHPASEYRSCKPRGVQLCFEAPAGTSPQGSVLTAIHCFNEGIDGFSRFDGALPHGLSLDDTNVQVVERLGEPHNKGGTNVPVWIEYQDKGVQVNFKGLSFDDRSNPIASLTLFAPDPSASATAPPDSDAERPAADAERLADVRKDVGEGGENSMKARIGELLERLDALD